MTSTSLYDQEYFTVYGKYFANGVPTYDLALAERCAKSINDLLNIRSVLDCGCAHGWLLHGFKMVDETIRIRGVDISEYAVSNALPAVRSYLQVGDISDGLGFGDKEFELVTAFDVLEHIPGYERLMKAVSEICRVTNHWILLRQPMGVWYKSNQNADEEHDWVKSLNPLPHKARQKMLGAGSKMSPSWPSGAREHPSEHPRDFWIALFESFGFRERALPEEMYIFPNDLMFTSFNVLLFEA
jgi:SAM-dependent methyltransferase